jgi:pSer/pThr/pTyr-binding forkhead associated (FHA) protein
MECLYMERNRLVVLTGSEKGNIFPISSTIFIGRNPENAIHLDDLQVSRKHAMVQVEAKGVILRDLGSGNGTFIGQRRILECVLSPGDIIRIGEQEIRYEKMEEAPQSEKNETTQDGLRFEKGDDARFQVANAATLFNTMFEPGAATGDQLRDAQKRLKAVYAANQVISSEQNLSKLFA